MRMASKLCNLIEELENEGQDGSVLKKFYFQFSLSYEFVI